MDQSANPPSSPRYRRPRVEGPRSKLGCGTCVSKKVKCDECRPFCGRCKRLNLACIWNPPKEKLKSKGLATSKSREGAEDLPTLLPKDSQETQYTTSMSGENLVNDRSGNSVTSQYLAGSNSVVSDTTDQECIIPPFGDQGSFTTYSRRGQDVNLQGISDTSATGFLDQGFNFYLDVWDPLTFGPLEIVDTEQGQVDLGENGPLGLSTIDTDDTEAVLFFRTTFSSLKSTRNSIWSAHAVFFFQASQKQSALHFLLAVSHNEFALHCGVASSESTLSDKAAEHYEKGNQLLLENIRGGVKPDPVADLISFLYMYMFWIRRGTMHSQRLREISTGVLSYVKMHEIADACVRSACTTLSSNLAQWSPSEDMFGDTALIARLLIYLYDRDVYCSFFGYGGQFASYLDADLERRRMVWSISRTFLLRYWGPNYPIDEFTQDIEHARTHEMYFDLITICQQINKYSQYYEINNEVCDEEAERILRRRLDSHQVDHSLMFHLVTVNDSPRPKIPLLAYVSVTFFYALQVYLMRASSQAFGAAPCPKVDSALRALISTAHLAIKAGPVQLLERFQWALLVGGIETRDVIHQEWIMSGISDLGVRNILSTILKRKKALGGNITVSAIRKLLEEDGGIAMR